MTTTSFFWTSSTDTVKFFLQDIASSRANLTNHLSSKFFRSSLKSMLDLLALELFLDDLQEDVFFLAGVSSLNSLSALNSPLVRPLTVIYQWGQQGRENFPSYGAPCEFCMLGWPTASSVKELQISQSFFCTQSSVPNPFS